MQRLSIIIPTLNEAACLAATLERLQALDPPAWEVLVVDGGSHDHTTAIAAVSGGAGAPVAGHRPGGADE